MHHQYCFTVQKNPNKTFSTFLLHILHLLVVLQGHPCTVSDLGLVLLSWYYNMSTYEQVKWQTKILPHDPLFCNETLIILYDNNEFLLLKYFNFNANLDK